MSVSRPLPFTVVRRLHELGPVFTCHSGPPRWVRALLSRHSVLCSALCPCPGMLASGDRIHGAPDSAASVWLWSAGGAPAAWEGGRRARSNTSFLGFLPAGGQRLAQSLLSHSPCQEALSKVSASHGFPQPFLPTPSGRGGTASRWVLCHPALISPDRPRTPVKRVCIQSSWGCRPAPVGTLTGPASNPSPACSNLPPCQTHHSVCGLRFCVSGVLCVKANSQEPSSQ